MVFDSIEKSLHQQSNECNMLETSILSTCHCVNLRRTSNHLTEFYSRMLEPCGLSLPQFSLLKNLSAVENSSTAALSRRVRLEHSTLVRNLQIMQTQGLIENEREAGRKLSVWRLTDRGRKKLQAGTPLWQKAQEIVEKSLGEENLERLKTMLIRLQNLEGHLK